MVHRLLLASSSNLHGTGYLDHCEDELRELFSGVRRVLFVPYALADHGAYVAQVRERLAAMGLAVDGLNEAEASAGLSAASAASAFAGAAAVEAAAAARAAVERAEAVFVGGGNTFRLLDAVQRRGLLGPLRARVLAGMPYAGTSAGSNLACPTLKTTNDMPIVEPPSFEALGLVPFQINPHYVDPDPGSTHKGETREQRLREFHEENATRVIGLREGAMLRVRGASMTLTGVRGARLFERGVAPREAAPGADLSDWLRA